MSFQINADQQRIEASGAKPTGNWTNATYSRTAGGVGNIVSVAHGIICSISLSLKNKNIFVCIGKMITYHMHCRNIFQSSRSV